MRVGIVGHRLLSDATTSLVREATRGWLTSRDPQSLVGLSFLADGADQLVAQAILDLGGALEVIVPAVAYRAGLPEHAQSSYDDLLQQARNVHRLDFRESTAEAHMAGGRELVNRSGVLLAVWDGQPARGFGGTADIVTYARSRMVPVHVIWPAGSTRD